MQLQAVNSSRVCVCTKPLPSQLKKLVLDLGTLEGCKAELT